MAKEEKVRFRRQAEDRIAALAPEERSRRSEQTSRRILALPPVQSAKTVAVYAPLDDELDLWPLIHSLAALKKQVLFPRCLPDIRQMVCVRVDDFSELAPQTFDILEPTTDRIVDISQIDVVLTPGRAFDAAGNRIGRGAGYYDRFFLSDGCRAFKCGVAFDCQIFPHVPFDGNDVRMDAVVTESATYSPSRPSGS